MSRSESIAEWSPSAASSVAPVLDGDQSACSPRECLNQFTRSTCPTNGDHLIHRSLKRQATILASFWLSKTRLGVWSYTALTDRRTLLH